MPDFHIVRDQNAITFDDAKKAFSAEMREGLARAAARARIPEDDVFWGLLVALTELSNTGLEAQSKLIKAILDPFVSARSAENKQLAALLTSCQTSLSDSTTAVSKHVESLANTLVQTMGTERDARAKESGQVQRQLETLGRDIRDVTKAAEMVRNINYNVFWIATGVALLSGAGLTLAIEHFLFHL